VKNSLDVKENDALGFEYTSLSLVSFRRCEFGLSVYDSCALIIARASISHFPQI
jgi:hypothetical protein